jgi:hypothetical protein
MGSISMSLTAGHATAASSVASFRFDFGCCMLCGTGGGDDRTCCFFFFFLLFLKCRKNQDGG